MLSQSERVAFDRGQDLKRYVRAAAALRGVFDDVTLGDRVGRTRNTIGKWWAGAKPEPDALHRIAQETDLSADELIRFVYFDGPPPVLPDATPLPQLTLQRDVEVRDELEAGPTATPDPQPTPATRKPRRQPTGR